MRNRIVADFESLKRKSKKTATEISRKAASSSRRTPAQAVIKRNTTSAKLLLQFHERTSVAKKAFKSELKWKCLAAQEEERKRIARELHDGLNQELALMAINFGILLRQMPKELSAQNALISVLQQRMESLSEAVRKMTHRLHPAALEHLGLVAALRSHCIEFSRTSQIPVVFTEVHVPKLPQSISVCLYRIVQESLLNVAKHSMATEACIQIKRAPGGILLSIADNGCGFKCDGLRGADGLGLISIRERVQAIHGQLIINSAPGSGLRLEIYAPVRSKAKKREKENQESNPLIAG
jgi:signal transduction histidine kinase